MNWFERYPRAQMPSMEDISAFIDNPLWEALRAHLEDTYRVSPKTEYSTCSGAPGWNVKYRKSGRALCTLYPDKGMFTCLVTVGAREATAAETMMASFSPSVQRMYQDTKPLNGARWLMIRVTDDAALSDVERLVALRVGK